MPKQRGNRKRCYECGKRIRTMIRKGSGYCSENCKKAAMRKVLR